MQRVKVRFRWVVAIRKPRLNNSPGSFSAYRVFIIWLVSFMEYDVGFFDKDEGRIEPAPNPFEPDKVLPMCPV